MSSTERFTEALQLTHSFDLNVPQNARHDAERYLMDLRDSAEGLNLSFHIISNEAVNELRCFWAFNTVIAHLPTLAMTVDNAQAQELYRSLFAFIHRALFATPTAAPADYVVNKHAQMMVVGLQVFYPARWTSFFDDLFDMLNLRQATPYLPTADLVPVYVLRVFEYVDERVVCVRDRQERGKQQRARDMELKDAMREKVIPQAVNMWYNTLLSDARVRNPDVSKLCLSVVQTYIGWVDLSLFMTADWINLLYFLLTVPPLRIAACECLLSLVEKKQLPGIKMESLRTLNVVDSLPRMMSLFELPPPSEEAVLFIDAVVKVAVAVAEQFLALLDTCSALTQQQQLSATAAPAAATAVIELDGMVLQDRPFTVTSELLARLSNALHAVFTQVCRALQLNLADVQDVVLPFLQLYLKSAYLLYEEAVELLSILFFQTRISGVANDEDRVWDDAFIDQRKALYNLLRLLHRRYPELVMSHLQSIFINGMDQLSSGAAIGVSAATAETVDDMRFTNPEVLEAALRYLFEIGESLRLENLKDTGDTTTQLLQRLLTTDAVMCGEVTCVHLAYFEVLGRYYLFFAYHPSFIPLLLQRLLLQPCGVMNQSDRVRARICYLFGYLIQVLKGHLGAYAADMVNALHSIITTAPRLTANDRRELYEATGILLSICSEEGQGGVDGADAGDMMQLAMSSHTENCCDGTPMPADALSRVAPLLGRKAELVHAVVESALQSLQEASASCSDMNVGGSSGANSSSSFGSIAAIAHPVAEVISCLSALAKGLGSADSTAASAGSPFTSSSSSKTGAASSRGSMNSTPNASALVADPQLAGCSGISESAASLPTTPSLTNLFIAQTFLRVTQRVMDVAYAWAGSWAVRETVGQFFHQLINMLPFEMLQPHTEAYVKGCLDCMEAIPELSKLLRLMFQYANKAGGRGVASLTRLTPLLWQRLCAVGELNEASPVVCLGVVSESARERINVYKQFFTFLFSVSTWGCVAAFAFMPRSCWMSILRQLCYAVTLPAELELPKCALQVFEKLTQELNDTVVRHALEQYRDAAEGIDATSAQANEEMCRECLLRQALPTAFDILTHPDFDLDDAKNFLLMAEVLQLFRMTVTRFGDPAMQVLYDRVAPYLGETAAMECCTGIRDQPRVTATLKVMMKQLLCRVHDMRRGQQQTQAQELPQAP